MLCACMHVCMYAPLLPPAVSNACSVQYLTLLRIWCTLCCRAFWPTISSELALQRLRGLSTVGGGGCLSASVPICSDGSSRHRRSACRCSGADAEAACLHCWWSVQQQQQAHSNKEPASTTAVTRTVPFPPIMITQIPAQGHPAPPPLMNTSTHLQHCHVLVLINANDLGRILCATHERYLNVTCIRYNMIVGDDMTCGV